MKISNNLFGLLNVLSFLLSLPIVYVGIIANKENGGGECVDILRKPFLIMGVFIMMISIVGIIGSCYRVSWILWIYLFIMFLLVLSYLSMWILLFFVTWKPGGGTKVPGTKHREYKVSEYSEWMQHRVKDEKSWKKIKYCLIHDDLCSLMPKNGTSLQEFNKVVLSPVVSSCCKPLAECGFSYENPTVWKKNNSASTPSNPDCKAWDNDPKVRCFNCESCKAGFLELLLITWRWMHLPRTVMLGFLCLVYAVGCRAFKNTRKETCLYY